MKKLLVLLLALSLYSLNAQVYDTLVWADEFNGTGGVDTSIGVEENSVEQSRF